MLLVTLGPGWCQRMARTRLVKVRLEIKWFHASEVRVGTDRHIKATSGTQLPWVVGVLRAPAWGFFPYYSLPPPLTLAKSLIQAKAKGHRIMMSENPLLKAFLTGSVWCPLRAASDLVKSSPTPGRVGPGRLLVRILTKQTDCWLHRLLRDSD